MRKFFILFMTCSLISLPAFAQTDSEEATPTEVKQWRAEADKGNAESQFNLAEALQKGEGVDQDEKEAAIWYYKSAVQGFVDAQFAMGFVCRGGSGVPMDKVLSYMWFDIASKNGDERAFGLRNDVAWSMTESEIDEARKKSRSWKIGSLEGDCAKKAILDNPKKTKK